MSRLPLLRLLHYGQPYQVQIWSAIACSILNTIFDLAPPYLIGIAIDVVVNKESSLIAQFGIHSIARYAGLHPSGRSRSDSYGVSPAAPEDGPWVRAVRASDLCLQRTPTPVLTDLSLHIPAGATIGIVGATGSGKSTLVKLLLRSYEVQQGRILIDGLDLHDLNVWDLRRAIGWVSQDVFLFHGTVAENIAYGSFEASREQIIRAADLAEAHTFIEQLPQGYDTVVGERGQKLSGGQRQRLAIARALLKNPPILVLDEATSAIDNETEAAIQKSLAKITQNRTTIAIAHRLSTIRQAHCIYVMEAGQLVEQGNHQELLDLRGRYARLWQIQSGTDLALIKQQH